MANMPLFPQFRGMPKHEREFLEQLWRRTGGESDRIQELETLMGLILSALKKAEAAAGVSNFVDLSDVNPSSITDGDIYYGDSGAVKALAKGSNDEVLTLKSGVPSWEVNSGTGLWEELQSATSITADDTTVAFFSGSDTASDFRLLLIYVSGFYGSASNSIEMQFREESGGSWVTSGYDWIYRLRNANNSHFNNQSSSDSVITIADRCGTSAAQSTDMFIYVPYPGNTNRYRNCWWDAAIMGSTPHLNFSYGSGSTVATDAIDACRFSLGSTADVDGGDVEIWGVRV